MKKLLLIAFVVVLMNSCNTSRRFHKTETYFVDFRPFTEKGFLMTTQPITDKYQSVGEITFKCQAGYDLAKAKKANTGDDVYFNATSKTPPIQCELDDVLNQLYLKAKDMGANGLVQIRIEYHLDNDKLHSFTDIAVTGLAVKIGN